LLLIEESKISFECELRGFEGYSVLEQTVLENSNIKVVNTRTFAVRVC